MDFHQRVGTNHLKIFMESEKTLNSQRNIEKENQSQEHHTAGFQAVLQSCDHQDSVVLAQKKDIQVNGTEERIQKWTLNSMVNSSSTKHERRSNGKKIISSINGVGKIGQPHAEK